MQPPQYNDLQPRYKQLGKWYQSRNRSTKALLICGLVFTLIALFDFVGIGTAAIRSGDPAAFLSTVTAPMPTDTPTPTPIPTIETKSTDLASAVDVASGATAYGVKGRWDGNKLIIEATQGPEFDKSGIINSGEQNIFYIEQTLWKQGGFSASVIEVDVMVQLVDKYGKESPGVALSATLIRETADKFVWDNLSSDTAWNAYDDTWVLPSLQGG